MSRLAGRRILLVEDELLLAMTLEHVLGAEGCVVVGPFPRVEPALKAAREEPLDAAVLDINLGGDRVYPVAQVLAERNACSPPATIEASSRGSMPGGPL